MVEVLVAIIILTVGVLALAGTSALSTRMIGQGRRTSNAVQVATRRIELLRQVANTTNPRCTALANGTATAPGRMTESWQVTATAGGQGRTVLEIVTYPTNRGMLTDTVLTIIHCL